MNLFASTCFILLSSDTGFVFGSNIRGSTLGSEHGDQYIMGNFALRSEGVHSEETADDTPRALFKEAEVQEYNLRTRQAFISFLKEGNGVPGIPVDTDLPSEESKDEQERDGTFIVGNVSFQEAMGESISEGSMQLIRGNGGTSYHKNKDKGCRNYYGKKGSNHHDYDLIEGCPERECEIKCNDLGDHCYGYEYSSYHQRCEIWRVSIEHVQYVYGFDCYIKNKSTPHPTKEPTPYPTQKPTPYLTKKPTPYPTKHPPKKLTSYPTERPTEYGVVKPTLYPTEYPTKKPTEYPTKMPTKYPTKMPTKYPTKEPTYYPTKRPTPYPTKKPTNYPTKRPTEYPTKTPTEYPTKRPTEYPTKRPTPYPTKKPTPYPTKKPTPYPTKKPTPYPTKKPTPYPTKKPTPYPTKKPTPYPTKKPTPYPTKKPTPYPTKKPTAYPTEYATEGKKQRLP